MSAALGHILLFLLNKSGCLSSIVPLRLPYWYSGASAAMARNRLAVNSFPLLIVERVPSGTEANFKADLDIALDENSRKETQKIVRKT